MDMMRSLISNKESEFMVKKLPEKKTVVQVASVSEEGNVSNCAIFLQDTEERKAQCHPVCGPSASLTQT